MNFDKKKIMPNKNIKKTTQENFLLLNLHEINETSAQF